MDISEVESKLGFMLPERHRKALQDPSDPIHEACEFLKLTKIVPENEWIHGSDYYEPWPNYLIAFASQGCGDYFAYDTRKNPATIIYVDPDQTATENVESSDRICYDTFEDWYQSCMVF